MRMPDSDERSSGYDPEDDGPQWDEGRNDLSEGDLADLINEWESEDD